MANVSRLNMVQQKRIPRNLKLLYGDALYLCPNDEGFGV
jgi:hypothetical protein